MFGRASTAILTASGERRPAAAMPSDPRQWQVSTDGHRAPSQRRRASYDSRGLEVLSHMRAWPPPIALAHVEASRTQDERGPTAAWPHVPSHLAPADRRLIADLFQAFAALRRSEAQLLRVEGAHFAFLRNGRCKNLGFVQASDVCRELFQIPDRTARERVTLHRALGKSRKLERLFLKGKVTSCQILAIAPMLDGPYADRWIERARMLTVRKLKEEVRRRKPGIDHPERHSRRRITLDVPVEVAATFQEFIEVGRKVIGYDCPPGEVVEAILAENSRAGLGNVADLPKRDASPPRRVPARMSGPTRPISPSDFADAERLIERIRNFEDQVEQVLKARGLQSSTASQPLTADRAFQAFDDLLKHIRGMHHPLRVLQTRLIYMMRRIHCDRRLGFANFDDFVSARLHISPRVAREMIRESEIFEQQPPLETAFLAGRIGTSKAHLVRAVAGSSDIDRWIGRAEHVLVRAFERECRLILLLRRYDPRIARRFPGPFPQPGMIAGLSEEVRTKHGLTLEELEIELRRRDVVPFPPDGVFLDAQGKPLSDVHALDPAKNPPLMRRLEVLVLLLCTSSARDDGPARKRQMFAVCEPHTLFAFNCSDEVAADFSAMNRAFEEAHGPFVQHWVPLSLAALHAVDTWTLQDPEREVTQWKILTRDEHHCTFPGCSKRGTLEVNHARPRSLGGSNDPSNLHGLCFGHHRDVFHAGHARISGAAPHSLCFEVGIRPGDGRPLMITLGNYIIERP